MEAYLGGIMSDLAARIREPHRWVAVRDAAQVGDRPWQPCLDGMGGWTPSIAIWFTTEDECEKWIATNLPQHGNNAPEIATALDAVERVRALHIRDVAQDLYVCSACFDFDAQGLVERALWPCPTIRALDGD